MLAEATRLAPAGAVGHATGAVLSVTFAGVVTGPTLFAFIFSSVGSYAVPFALLAGLPLAGAVVAWRGRRLRLVARTAPWVGGADGALARQGSRSSPGESYRTGAASNPWASAPRGATIG